MKKRIVLFHAVFSILLFVVIMTTSTAHSGGNSSNTPCSNCHNSATDPGGSISLVGVPSAYIANQVYNLTLCINDNIQPIAGFRLSANLGIFSNPGAGAQIASNKLLHNTPATIIAGNACWTGDWMAPSSGNVTFQYYGNAANNNGQNGAGDHGGYVGFIANVPLPVVFSSIELSETLDHYIQVDWSTQSELNNQLFVIESGQDGSNFRSKGEISGNGTSSRPLDYTFVDKTPSPGINYYRLVQIDFDGTRNYSETYSINHQNIETVNIRNTIVNPILYIDNVQNDQEGEIHVFGLNGQHVSTFDLFEEIDLSHLRTGYYFVSLFQNNFIQTKRIFRL